MAYPTQVQAVCAQAITRHPDLNVTAHLHNTRAMGLVNTVAAVEAGVRQFDMSLGGTAVAPTRRARRATWRRKTWCTCLPAWGTAPVWTSVG
jgi:pyruvate/oxaloacetate carboxyltransferase